MTSLTTPWSRFFTDLGNIPILWTHLWDADRSCWTISVSKRRMFESERTDRCTEY